MKRRYRILIVLACVAVTLVVLVTAFYGIENWRGAREWERVRRELAAQGESLDAADFIPPPVPDERNLAMIPLFAKALDYRVDPQTHGLALGPDIPKETPFRDMPFGHDGQKPPSSAFGSWEAGQPMPMEAMQRFYAKQDGFPHPAQPGAPHEDVLLALTKFAPTVEEIEAAVAVRPQTRFPVRWTQWPPSAIAVPHWGLIQKLVSVLRLRALAYLHAGRHADAARDLALAFHLRASTRTEPTLIAYLIAITCDNMLLQPIWEGIVSRRWTADELREIQRELRADDLLANFGSVVRGERAVLFCRLMDGYRKRGSTRELGPLWDDKADQNFRATYQRIADFFPRGWIDQNEASVCLAYQELITSTVDPKTRRVSVTLLKAHEEQTRRDRTKLEPSKIMQKIITPVMWSIVRKTAPTQTACEQAELACALERYFLEHQSYPQNLAALVPDFIDRVPTDLIAGTPMRYRLTENGRYLLYAVGWNERDDGGVVGWSHPASAPAKPDKDEGDWVWQYEPISPPAR